MSFDPAPPICPIDLRRSVPARIVEDIDALGPGGGQPGDLMPLRRSTDGALWGFAYRCVGCGMETALPVNPPDAGPRWTVTAGDPMTGAGLTLSPSIWHNGGRCGCGWHGWLRDGVFAPC